MTALSHVYVIVLENRSYSEIVGASDAPYLNSLIADYGLATNYHSLTHPSQPNYIALVSGSTQGIADDGSYDVTAPNLADQLEAAGKSWADFQQDYPGSCFTGGSASGGPDGPGTYARKHNPFISFTAISADPARCANITDFSSFDPAAADFELIVPNELNDMHSASTAQGDAFMRSFVPRILQSDAWRLGGVLFITWDEGGGDHVPLIVVSSLTPAGTRSNLIHDHYSLLRAIEDGFGLPCLANACSADDLAEFFSGG
jgi:phosphatidylinositol-3-phosphatase